MKKSIFFFITLFLPCNLFAQESAYQAVEAAPIAVKNPISIKSQIRVENLNVDNYHTTDEANEHPYSEAKANFISNFTYNEKWFAEVQVRLENIEAANEKNRNYNNEGAYLRELKVGYNGDNFLFYAGKFRPFFGIAWRNGRYNWYDYAANNLEQFDYNNTRGIWSDYIAQNYAQNEKLGVGTVVKAGNEKTVGKYELGLSFFTNDRKNLDNSVLNSRSSATKSDALPGDTRSLSSYTASLDVSYDFSFNEKLFYRFAYINLATNSNAVTTIAADKIADQKGLSLAMNYQYPFSRLLTLNGLLEYVEMKNVGGNSDVEDKYLNASLVANIYHNWNITGAYGSRANQHYGLNGFDQTMAEISAGYRFDKTVLFDSFLIQAGYRNLRSDYKINVDERNSLGILLRYIKNF